MMKSKFKAGLAASIISLVIIVGAAIAIVAWTEGNEGDKYIKAIAAIVIAIWLGLYNWFKPKPPVDNAAKNL